MSHFSRQASPWHNRRPTAGGHFRIHRGDFSSYTRRDLAPRPRNDDGFGSRSAWIRFAEFSAGVHEGRIIFGGEAVLTTGPPQLDLQAAGGLYDPIAFQALPARIASAIRYVLPVLTGTTLCDAIGREQHFDPGDARLSALTAAQKGIVASVDRMGNIAPKFLKCEISGNTVTFYKQSALDSASPKRHIYGAIRFLPPPYSSFHLIRGGGDVPTAELLRQITTVVNSWKKITRTP